MVRFVVRFAPGGEVPCRLPGVNSPAAPRRGGAVGRCARCRAGRSRRPTARRAPTVTRPDQQRRGHLGAGGLAQRDPGRHHDRRGEREDGQERPEPTRRGALGEHVGGHEQQRERGDDRSGLLLTLDQRAEGARDREVHGEAEDEPHHRARRPPLRAPPGGRRRLTAFATTGTAATRMPASPTMPTPTTLPNSSAPGFTTASSTSLIRLAFSIATPWRPGSSTGAGRCRRRGTARTRWRAVHPGRRRR